MAPAKRARPTFSPPRPIKSKKAMAQSKGKDGKRLSTNARKTNGVSKPTAKVSRRRKQPEMVLVDSEAESETEDDVVGNTDEDKEAADSSEQESDDEEVRGDSAQEDDALSPEPSVILAEVTREDASNLDQYAIPIPLLHRLLHHHFADKEKTKISTDAREVIAKYIEVFVREAIMRSTFENSARNTSGAGWLEVEDLERTAVQLCLDF